MTGVLDGFWRLLRGKAAKDFERSNTLVAKLAEDPHALAELSEEELRTRVAALREDYDERAYLEVAREVAARTLSMRPFDVQLLCASRLLAGDVVEQATGEGKTLAGALAAAGFVLRGRSTQVMSVNDYLARRDAEWMGPFYDFLGVSVGWLTAKSTADERRAAYQADVTYAAVSEIGFDVLRDRLCVDVDALVGREPDVLLVDEADSVLVDEARVPLVLAGSTSAARPDRGITEIVSGLKPSVHYRTDREQRNVYLTDAGARAVERALGGGVDLYDSDHISNTLTQVNVALHAHALLKRDVHYIVRDEKVHLINESRGRVARLQRWPDGLQAAVEAKEDLPATETGEVLDSITVQALIRRYPLMCGMTGTALAAAESFRAFYEREVSVIPPNKPRIRVDEPDRVYTTIEVKEAAIIKHVAERHETGQPVLIGTQDVAESERLAAKLAESGITAVVLNARNDAEEAAIVAEAGTYGRVTVSTQMAGRGTDIRLGGSDEADRERVVEAGGLFVIGTSRHVSSRLDDQLRGRAGRQGDPGRSVFYSCLEDELVQHHAPDEHPAGRADSDGRFGGKNPRSVVDHAQRVAEGALAEIHTSTWRYSKLIEHQRDVLGREREELLRTDKAWTLLEKARPERCAELSEIAEKSVLVVVARQIMLYHLDRCWAEHLAYVADLRESIHLHALSRSNPLDEFHRAVIPAFKRIAEEIDERSTKTLENAVITATGLDENLAGMNRPTSTWTYLVNDNPFGTEIDRTLQSFAKARRRR